MGVFPSAFTHRTPFIRLTHDQGLNTGSFYLFHKLSAFSTTHYTRLCEMWPEALIPSEMASTQHLAMLSRGTTRHEQVLLACRAKPHAMCPRTNHPFEHIHAPWCVGNHSQTGNDSNRSAIQQWKQLHAATLAAQAFWGKYMSFVLCKGKRQTTLMPFSCLQVQTCAETM